MNGQPHASAVRPVAGKPRYLLGAVWTPVAGVDALPLPDVTPRLLRPITKPVTLSRMLNAFS
jgi:hypothetical protein